jgi:hypothetical protein
MKALHPRTLALLGLLTLWLGPTGPATAVEADFSAYQPSCGVAVRQEGTLLHVRWPIGGGEHGVLSLQLRSDEALIEELGIAATADGPAAPLLRTVRPVTFLTVGIRDLSKQGWDVFFDNPPRRPHETYPAALEIRSARVQSQGRRASVVLDGLSAGPFRGELRFTVYPGCRLVHTEAVLHTDRDACVILYAAGLSRPEPDWESVAWIDTRDRLQRVAATAPKGAATVAARHRAVVAEGGNGSVAVFPPPHQFLYPLDFADNFQLAWHGRGFSKAGDAWGFGVRQPPEGDGRFVPWVNAPPGTRQRRG